MSVCCVPGRLINTIRVLCSSYEDYSHWLLCLQTVSHREGATLLPGPESLPGLRAPTQVRGQQGGAGRGSVRREPAMQLTPCPPTPGPGQWPRLTLFRWTDQLGLRGPSAPLHPYQPLPPRVLSTAHSWLPLPACTCECGGQEGGRRGGGQEASLCWAGWVPVVLHSLRDASSSGVVWERAPSIFWKILFPPGPGQPRLCRHQWAEGRAQTGWQQSVTQKQGQGRRAWFSLPATPGPDQGGPSR